MQIKNVNKTFRTQWIYGVGSTDYQEALARGWKRQIFTEPSRSQTMRVEPRLNKQFLNIC